MSTGTARCDSVDNFYRCTRPEGHDGNHEARDGCIIGHQWPAAGSVTQEEPA